MSDEGNVILVVQGGMGKHLMATVPIRGIAKKYPNKKLIVVCGYPELFQFNPHVAETYRFGNTPHFFDHFIQDGNSTPLRAEPYFHPDYVAKKKHLTECWCEMLDVPFDNTKPDFYLKKSEDRDAIEFIRAKNKPVLFVQPFGGPGPQVDKEGKVIAHAPKMFVRSLPTPIVQGVCADMAKEHGYHVMVMAAPTQTVWDGVERVTYPIRNSLALIKHAQKLLLIDSVGQHAAAAFGRQAVVCWAGTSPDCLGYKSHINLRQKECPTPECHRPNSFFFDLTTTGQWECPYGDLCVENYDQQDIIDALKKAK